MNNKDRGNLIRKSILSSIANSSEFSPKLISEQFGISVQAVNTHINKLIDDGWIATSGGRKNRRYFLGEKRSQVKTFEISQIKEDVIWRKEFYFVFNGLKENVIDICHYGFTEIVNNVIDHSNGHDVTILVERNECDVLIMIADDGEGIFKKITRIEQLEDERQALLELSKGKLTTDPDNHSGEGIFFASRMFDKFVIHSKGLVFSHHDRMEFDLLQEIPMPEQRIGTLVMMLISVNSERTAKSIYDQFTDGPSEFKFNKTVIPVRMAQYENEKLISRSQAKRLLNRIEKFHWVVFDFDGVVSIGQGFADEIFRVYANKNPHITLTPINMNDDVNAMINRALPS